MSVAVRCIALACGGESGSRLAKRLGIKFSPDTLLRETRRTSVPTKGTPRVLGVDDWEFRKGQHYGTVLVDLEKNCPVDLLPGREVLARLTTRHSKQIREIARELVDRQVDSDNLDNSGGESVDSPSLEEKTPSIASQRRRERYSEVMALYHQGVSQRNISRRLGLARSIVRRFVQSDAYPDRAQRKFSSHADGCVEYLWKRWQNGCHNVRQLTKEIQVEGFTASYYSVRRRVAGWHKVVGQMPNQPPAKDPAQSPVQLSWMVSQTDASLTNDQAVFKDRGLEQCSENLSENP